jgi:sugar/nucleoside kinase (ribokinase family)
MDVLCFGSLVVDLRRPDSGGPPADEPLRLVDGGLDLRIGGVAILAAAMKRLGLDVGLMGCVGRDIAGFGLLAYLQREMGIDVEAVQAVAQPTSSSFIRLSPGQRHIEHTPGASCSLLPGSAEVDVVRRRKPTLVAIGYAGLLPRLDADHGEPMARWMAAVRATGALVALDTHTCPPYAMLDRPVPLADIFLCNLEEAEGITCMAVSPDSRQTLGDAIWSKYPQACTDRHRLIGIAVPEGLQVAYGRGAEFVNQWVPNPHFGTFTPTDLTGAGDYLRAGVYAHVVEDRAAFAEGRLDLRATGVRGHDTASRHLQNRATEP